MRKTEIERKFIGARKPSRAERRRILERRHRSTRPDWFQPYEAEYEDEEEETEAANEEAWEQWERYSHLYD